MGGGKAAGEGPEYWTRSSPNPPGGHPTCVTSPHLRNLSNRRPPDVDGLTVRQGPLEGLAKVQDALVDRVKLHRVVVEMSGVPAGSSHITHNIHADIQAIITFLPLSRPLLTFPSRGSIMCRCRTPGMTMGSPNS